MMGSTLRKNSRMDSKAKAREESAVVGVHGGVDRILIAPTITKQRNCADAVVDRDDDANDGGDDDDDDDDGNDGDGVIARRHAARSSWYTFSARNSAIQWGSKL